MRVSVAFLLTSMSCALISCANLNSISRSTNLPKGTDASAKAIHLDAKQRLVISDGITLCAEASPDALSVAASGTGFGFSNPSNNAASLSNSQQESAAAIGLRTQSISLQREILYRICEASYNGKLGPIQVGTLLGRSQDLTAVVLAVEQLTGAVVAQQAALTGKSSARSTATLISNQKALEAAREYENDRKIELDGLIVERDKLKIEELPLAKTKAQTSSDAHTAALGQTPVPSNINALLEAKETDNAALTALKEKIEAKESNVEIASENYSDAKRVRETIQATLDSALAATSASAGGEIEFANSGSAVNLNDQSTEHVAKAVQAMVIKALDKPYVQETCLGIISSMFEIESSVRVSNFDAEEKKELKNAGQLCLFLLSKEAQKNGFTFN